MHRCGRDDSTRLIQGGLVGFKYAITLASFKDIEPLEQTLDRISELGFDAVEMYGEPERADVGQLAELFNSYRMVVCGVTGMWGTISEEGWKRKLLSSNIGIRRHASDYVKKSIKMCHLLGGKHLNICLFADNNLSPFEKTHRTISSKVKAEMQSIAVPILSELATFAAEHDVRLLVEPLNRYSTPYCSTANDALTIVEMVNKDNVGLMLDTFHMNIEEDSFQQTIANMKQVLHHMHFADNNRKMPGYGHIDFKVIVEALIHAGYNGYATFEPTIYDKKYEVSLQKGLQYINRLESGAA